MKIKQIVILLTTIGIMNSCSIGPIYTTPLNYENAKLNLHDKNVIVTKFYKAQTQLSYLDDFHISRILESASLNDISFTLAQYLKSNEIEAMGMKEVPVSSLKNNEVMLSGALITKSIPFEENFPFPGMLICFLIGNVLPSPAAYKSGIDIMYHYDLKKALNPSALGAGLFT